MSALTTLGSMYQSRRMARDVLERRGNVLTHPWWRTANISVFVPVGFSADPNPDREPPEWSPVWITIGTGSVPPR